jgi:transcriptional regulator GlxA family with amidase domain
MASSAIESSDLSFLHADTETLQKHYPACRVQKDRRVVIAGNLVTSPGGLASYEASLYVVKSCLARTRR